MYYVCRYVCVYGTLSIQVVDLDGKRNKAREAVRKLKKLHPSLDKQSVYKMKRSHTTDEVSYSCLDTCIWFHPRLKDVGLLWKHILEDEHRRLCEDARDW